jgi:transcriptional regulator with XRE-family HTH domain
MTVQAAVRRHVGTSASGPMAAHPVAGAREPHQGMAAQTALGDWLRTQRLARGWSIAEMARQLHRAAKAASDNTVTSMSIMTTYVRRWEAGKITPTERYQLHYCSALGIALAQFGRDGTPRGREGRAESASQLGETAGCVIVVIPRNCRRIVIEMTERGESSGPPACIAP